MLNPIKGKSAVKLLRGHRMSGTVVLHENLLAPLDLVELVKVVVYDGKLTQEDFLNLKAAVFSLDQVGTHSFDCLH